MEQQLLLLYYCRSCTDLLVLSLPTPQVARANFNEDPYVQDFGISIDQKMVTVTGRILPPPLLQYGGKIGKQVRCVPIANVLYTIVSNMEQHYLSLIPRPSCVRLELYT